MIWRSAEFRDRKLLIRRISRNSLESMNILSTGCGYCKPCPEGVDIPSCFDSYTHLHMYQKPEEAKFTYAIRLSGMISGQPGLASQCIQCGECLDKCPQGLQIPDLLGNVKDELEDVGLQERIAWGRQYLNMESRDGD